MNGSLTELYHIYLREDGALHGVSDFSVIYAARSEPGVHYIMFFNFYLK